MGASLVVVHVDGRQHEVQLSKPVNVVGRSTDCTIRIPSGKISRHHCEISVADGKFGVRDLGSSNGTYVNRRRVTQTDLGAGDMISVGDFVFVLRVDGKPGTVDSEEVIEDGLVLAPNGGGSGSGGGGGERKRADRGPNSETSTPNRSSAGAGPGGSGASAKPPAKPSVMDSDGSSVGDFDFLGEDDDMKKQPKL